MSLEILIILVSVFGIVGYVLRIDEMEEKLLDIIEPRSQRIVNTDKKDIVLKIVGTLRKYRKKLGIVMFLIATMLGLIAGLMSVSANF